MTTWDVSTDFLVIGSGGDALVGALRASALGKEVIVCEKLDKIGGSTKTRAASAAPDTGRVRS
jgi:succinate dehydrogenase/fumarate reductase flavoprotein subunit